jgi:hypothetical protein
LETWKLEKGGSNLIKWLERKRPEAVFGRFFAYIVSEEATGYSHCERRENGPQLENSMVASRLGEKVSPREISLGEKLGPSIRLLGKL